MTSFPVILINSLSVLMICVVIAITWKKRTNSGALQLIVLSIFMLIWAIGSFTEMAVIGNANKIFWRNITQIGVFYTPPACLFFAMAYTGFLSAYRKPFTYGIFTVQTVSILLILTDHWHHLMRTGIEIVRRDLYETVLVSTTTLSKILISLNFVYMTVALFLLIAFAVRTTKKMRRQVLIIIVGMGAAILYAFIKVASSEHFGMMVPISGIFALTSLSMLFGIVKHDLFIVEPIARNALFDIVDDGIIIASTNSGIIEVNQAVLNIFSRGNRKGTDKEMAIGRIEEIIREKYPKWCDALGNGRAGKFKISWIVDGDTYYYQCDIYAIESNRGKTIGSISVVKDITDQKRKSDLLKYRAEKDGLTGIYNRQAFVERVERALSSDTDVCLLFFDIDDFKRINDQYGHICGDDVLREVCLCIAQKVDKSGLFGRIGGEEFAVFIKSGIERAAQLAEVLRSVVAQHRFTCKGERVDITISMGISTGRRMTFDQLYHIADLNLYKAKEAGKNRVRF